MTYHKWTQERLDFLINNYKDASWETLTETLDITKNNLLHKACELGLSREYEYTESEIEFIKNNYSKMSYRELGRILGRSDSAIQTKVNNLGLIKSEKWSDEEIELLKKIYPIYSNKYLGEKYFPNRGVPEIRTKALKLGIHKSDEKGVKWYDAEKMLDQLKELAIKLGRTPLYSELPLYGLPSDTSYRRYFGGYRNACELVDLDINFSFFGTGRALKSKNGDVCFSNTEVRITNFFIENNIDYAKEELYSNWCDDERCSTKRVDWIIGTNTFVEYFGMPNNPFYAMKMEVKKSICRDCNIDLISILPKDLKFMDDIFKDFIN